MTTEARILLLLILFCSFCSMMNSCDTDKFVIKLLEQHK